MSHAQEAEYLAQLRKQQAKGKQQSKSGAPKANKKHSDDGSTSDTSSVDTHLDECDICDDGGGKNIYHILWYTSVKLNTHLMLAEPVK